MTHSPDGPEFDSIPVDVSARFATVENRIEHPLSAEQAALVRTRLARSIALGTALRQYPLTNADEPEIGFDPLGGHR